MKGWLPRGKIQPQGTYSPLEKRGKSPAPATRRPDSYERALAGKRKRTGRVDTRSKKTTRIHSGKRRREIGSLKSWIATGEGGKRGGPASVVEG